MSLQVWLPLNGVLKNQGLYNSNIINYNATISNNGKIGQCYSFNGSNAYISGTYNATENISFCAWVCLDEVKAAHIFDARSSSTSHGYQPIYIDNSKIQIGCSKSSYANFNRTWEINRWYHICVIHDNTGGYCYIDGELIGFNANSKGVNLGICNFTLGSRYNQNNYSHVRLNDIRIYDHALSKKEIEEIYKTLVLHYKLDNIINNTIYDCSGYGYNGSVIGAASLNTSTNRYNKSIQMNNVGSANHIQCNTVINLPTNGITVSFWAYTEKTNNYVLYIDQNMSFAVNASGGSFYVSRTSSAGFPMTEFKTNQWNHVVLIRNGDTYKAYINGKNMPRNQSNNNWTHQVSNIYLLNRKYNNNYAADASISDFRVYATELKESQIKELYNTSVTIDNRGNTYSRELVE